MGTFFIKRLNSGSAECSTLDSRTFDLMVCVGDTDAFAFEEADMDNFPPLEEVVHVPLLDTRIARDYKEHQLMPPPAHMLYVCLKCAEASVPGCTLYIAPQVLRDDKNVDAKAQKDKDPVKAEFLQYHSNTEKYLDEQFEVVELDPFELKFDINRKTPEVTDPGNEENSDHGLYYIRLLFLIGDDPKEEELEFRDTVVVDLADDSPAGFPPYIRLWVSKSKDSVRKKALREPTEKFLLSVDTLPERAVQESSGRDALESLGKMDDDDYEKIE